MPVFLALLAMGMWLFVVPAHAINVDYNFDGGPVKTAGAFDVTLEWIDAAKVAHKITLPAVPVAVKDDPSLMRNTVDAALRANTTIAADWTFKTDSAGFGKVQYTEGTPGAGVVFVGASIVPTVGKAPAGKITVSAGFVAQGPNPPVQNWFAVLGVGTAEDQIAVDLAMPGDLDTAVMKTFALPSYAGLDGQQIEFLLADQINSSGLGFAARVADSRVYVTGIGTLLGADVLISDVGNLLVSSGVAAVPEPGTLALAAVSLCALALARRRSAVRAIPARAV